ncbi:MAG: hypothetical protein U9Q81_08455 [Pseudomonadota bacterium]|nr:hypothetical protein [Pseudomonadota bacterium]
MYRARAMLAALLPLLIVIAASRGMPLFGAVLARQPLEQFLRITARSV